MNFFATLRSVHDDRRFNKSKEILSCRQETYCIANEDYNSTSFRTAMGKRDDSTIGYLG